MVLLGEVCVLVVISDWGCYCLILCNISKYMEGDEEEESKKQSSARSKKVYDFVRSPVLSESIAVATISSLPRWHLARAIFSVEGKEKGDQPEKPKYSGVKKALISVLNDTRYILSRKCPLVEHLLACTLDQNQARVKVLRSLLRTVVYLVKYLKILWVRFNNNEI